MFSTARFAKKATLRVSSSMKRPTGRKMPRRISTCIGWKARQPARCSAQSMWSGQWAITEADIAVKWDSREQRVGLFVFGTLVAAFDAATGAKYGGDYGKDFNAEVPWS